MERKKAKPTITPPKPSEYLQRIERLDEKQQLVLYGYLIGMMAGKVDDKKGA